jgi:hypothetical protein
MGIKKGSLALSLEKPQQLQELPPITYLDHLAWPLICICATFSTNIIYPFASIPQQQHITWVLGEAINPKP